MKALFPFFALEINLLDAGLKPVRNLPDSGETEIYEI